MFFFKSEKHGVPSPAEYILLLVLATALVAVILTLIWPLFLAHLGLLALLFGGG